MEIIAYKNGNKEEVLKLEKEFRIKLPQDYKDFLIEYNGGNVNNAYLYVKDLNEYMLMGNFFGIGIEKGFADIIKVNHEYDDDIPKKSLLIGTDAGNSFILLVNDGANDGIWFYDDSYFFEQSSDELNTYFICETFTEFMQMLKDTKLPEQKKHTESTKSEQPYKTYEGKDYTKEEWEKFEEEEYKKYVEKRNKKRSSFLADEETESKNFSTESGTLKEVQYFVMDKKGEVVQIYQYPSTMSKIIATLQNGTAIDVLEYKKDDWSEVLSKDGKKGYIYSSYIVKNH